jgi:hypothetical protein
MIKDPAWIGLFATLGIGITATVIVYGLLGALFALYDTRRARVRKAERALAAAQGEVAELKWMATSQDAEIEHLRRLRDLNHRPVSTTK